MPLVSEPPPPPPAAIIEPRTSYPAAYFAEARPNTALDMVQRLPGFAFDKGEAVRGYAGAAGNVLIDGQRPSSKSDPLDEILKRIPASAVVRIELIRGGAPGVDMQGKTVLANVVRRPSTGLQGSIVVYNGSVYDGRQYQGGRADLLRRWDDRTLQASLVTGLGPDDRAGEGPRRRIDATGRTVIQGDIDADGLGGKTTLNAAYEAPLADGRIRLNSMVWLNTYDLVREDTLTLPAGREREVTWEDYLQSEFGLSYTRAFGAGLDLKVLAIRQAKDTDTRSQFQGVVVSRDFNLDKEASETIGRLELGWKPRGGLSVEAGGESALNIQRSRTRFIQNGALVGLPAANVRVEELRQEVFATTMRQMSRTITLEAGLRFERSEIDVTGDANVSKTLSFAKPRLALAWSPSPERQVRLRLEREVGQLNFDDFAASASNLNFGGVLAGNPDLEPQQAWVVEAAYEQRFWRDGAVVLSVRYGRLDDVADRVPLVGPSGVFDAPGNIGEGEKLEVSLSGTLPLTRLGVRGAQIKGSATRRGSSVTDPMTGAQREISRLRPVEWELHFTQDLPAWRSNWGLDLIGGWRETNYRFAEIETRKLDTTVSAFLEHRLRPGRMLRLELLNLSARDVVRIREAYGARRTSGAPVFTEIERQTFGPVVYVRLRQSF